MKIIGFITVISIIVLSCTEEKQVSPVDDMVYCKNNFDLMKVSLIFIRIEIRNMLTTNNRYMVQDRYLFF
jgi:hypothetical protein